MLRNSVTPEAWLNEFSSDLGKGDGKENYSLYWRGRKMTSRRGYNLPSGSCQSMLGQRHFRGTLCKPSIGKEGARALESRKHYHVVKAT